MRILALILGTLAIAAPAHAVTVDRAPLKASSTFFTAMHGGRTAAAQGGGFRHQWPGTYWEASFVGPEITVGFDDAVNKLHIYIDKQLVDTETKPGRTQVRFSGLTTGPHWVRVEKATESQAAPAVFLGFATPPGGSPPPIPVPLLNRIEFIGDSYTVGYGNTSGKRECTEDEVWATTDTSQAFGPLTAKHYNADYQINAYSGRGIVRNYNGFIGDTLPGLYPYTLFDGKTTYKDANWQPQIIVVALGTNDFSTPVHAGEKWEDKDALVADYQATYVGFVKSLRAKNPNATFVLISYDPDTTPIISAVKDRLSAAGDDRVNFLEITGFNKNACNWHPDITDDRKISDALVAFIDGHPGIWLGK